MQNKIGVAISGGIDSFYALKQSLLHYENITAVFLNFLDKKEQIKKVRLISEYFKVPLQIFDCREEFKKEVIDYFTSEYLKGRTPNPCVICNEKFKFQYILKFFQKVITGHYACITLHGNKYFISRGIDRAKEQSYFLARLSKDILERVDFILGKKSKIDIKSEVGKEYEQFGVIKESQEICFIPNNNYKKFLEKYVGVKEAVGVIVSKNGKKLGYHKGFFNFTIGQRKGLNIAMGTPYYVTGIDAENNIVYAGPKDETFNKGFEIENILWYDEPDKYENIKVKVRYRTSEKLCKINNNQIFFIEDEQSVTPGQLAVFYWKNIVIGSGWINAVL